MKRLLVWSMVVALFAVSAPALRADVKTRQKTLVKFEGLLGAIQKLVGG